MNTRKLIELLEKYKETFHRVVPFNQEKDLLLKMDFTASNTALTKNILEDTARFASYVNTQLENAGARYGIGGYGEHRTVYSISKVFDGANENEEPRRLHLGTDIWGAAGTSVMAPLDGLVHSFAFNNQFGDYGATIILFHSLGGMNFYTLYGHLSLASIQNIKEGDKIEKGETFTSFGIASENGSWPAHLHFQIIENIEDWKGDYPGVCKFSEKEKWMANGPDPDLLLQLNQYVL